MACFRVQEEGSCIWLASAPDLRTRPRATRIDSLNCGACTGQPGGVEGQMRGPAGTAQRQTRRGVHSCLVLLVKEGMCEQCRHDICRPPVHAHGCATGNAAVRPVGSTASKRGASPCAQTCMALLRLGVWPTSRTG